MKRYLIFTLSILFCVGIANAQVSKTSELFLTLKKQDSLFFDRAFNKCDLEYLDKAVHKDIVFYHDQGGAQDKEKFMTAVKNNICSGTGSKPIRKVDEKSLEVFPLYNNGVLYGVIQTGVHNFYRREPNKPDVHTSIAKFTHVYLLENGNWILKEVLSYDHKEPGK